jgi:hypothetical protein
MSGGAVQIRWGEKPSLHHGADPVHDTRPKAPAAGELVGHRLQEGIALVTRKRPGRGQYSLQFNVAQGDRRHG